MTDRRQYSEALPLEILWGIFGRSEALSPRDVLRCRAVCKTWRDAATSFLLHCNAFEVVFKLEACPLERSQCGVALAPGWKKFINVRQSSSSVTDLTQLLSKSACFPSTTFRFRHDIGDGEVFGHLNVPCDSSEEIEDQQRDLYKFFLLHGFKIKSLTLPAEFPAKALSNILYVYLDYLECLDLQFFWGYSGPSLSQYFGLNLRLKTIILSEHFRDSHSKLLQELLTASPNLIEVQNVNICALDVLLTVEKSHLIQGFVCKPSAGPLPGLHEFSNLLANPLHCPTVVRPTLTEFTVSFLAMHEFCTNFRGVVSALNLILEGSKDTLKILDLRLIPVDSYGSNCKLKVPTMSKLELLVLSDDVLYNGCPFFTSAGTRDRTRYQFSNQFYTSNDRNAENIRISNYNSSTIFQFQNGNTQTNDIPQNYFPRLRKVQLNVRRDIGSWKKLVALFALDRFEVDDGGNGAGVAPGSVIPGDRIPTVTQLEMPCFIIGSYKLSKLFPNICQLIITSPCSLRNSYWTTFPLLKKFEICENPPNDQKTTAVFDSFFTGIPESVCSQLLEDPVVGLDLSPSQVNPLVRMEPFIGTCQHLTEFKIRFVSRLTGNFASRLSALYGFKVVSPQTRIVFSFASLGLSRKGVADMRKWLAPLRPYVHIEA